MTAPRRCEHRITGAGIAPGREQRAPDHLRQGCGACGPFPRERSTLPLPRKMTSDQVNAALLAQAPADARVMHCLPAHRGQEIDGKTFEAHAQTIFDQAENRLHVQKAILAELMES